MLFDSSSFGQRSDSLSEISDEQSYSPPLQTYNPYPAVFLGGSDFLEFYLALDSKIMFKFDRSTTNRMNLLKEQEKRAEEEESLNSSVLVSEWFANFVEH